MDDRANRHWQPEPLRPVESPELLDFGDDPLPYPVELPPAPEPLKLSFYERAKRWLIS